MSIVRHSPPASAPIVCASRTTTSARRGSHAPRHWRGVAVAEQLGEFLRAGQQQVAAVDIRPHQLDAPIGSPQTVAQVGIDDAESVCRSEQRKPRRVRLRTDERGDAGDEYRPRGGEWHPTADGRWLITLAADDER
jgi:hypothetical protein